MGMKGMCKGQEYHMLHEPSVESLSQLKIPHEFPLAQAAPAKPAGTLLEPEHIKLTVQVGAQLG